MFVLLAILAVHAEAQVQCRASNQSPVDIAPPFSYQSLNLQFYLGYQDTAFLYHDGTTVKLDGDFGGLRFRDSFFQTSELNFWSPSAHLVGGQRFPMEMQVRMEDQYGNLATLVVVFANSTRSTFLDSLGFGNPRLRDAPINTLFGTAGPVDLLELLGAPTQLLMYEGSTMVGNCQANVTYFILSDTFKVSEDQVANFPLQARNKAKALQVLGDRTIYTNFWLNELRNGPAEAVTGPTIGPIESVRLGQTTKALNDEFIVESDWLRDDFPTDFTTFSSSFLQSN
jgi:carbonic anhydrase